MEVLANVAHQEYMPWEPLLLLSVGDIQYEGPDGAADLPRLRRYLKWGMDHDAYFIGMGDYRPPVSMTRQRVSLTGRPPTWRTRFWRSCFLLRGAGLVYFKAIITWST